MSSIDIAQQFINGGVIPAQLVGQSAVSKVYVDGQLAERDTDISAAASAASAAQGSINTHVASSTAHSSSAITYTGPIAASNVKQAIDATDQRVSTIVAGAGASNTEILDARQPASGAPFTVLRDRLNNTDAQLADNAISPDHFTGTDTQRVQQAIDYAIENGNSIRFSRMYDLTGGTITLNKPSSNREILYLLGVGGGIKKDDVGIVFTATSADMGDIVSSNMKYSSISGSNTVIWNCDKLIRIVSSNDSYVNVDTIVRANTRYVQSITFSNCTITGGTGWAFEWHHSFDVTINNCKIEHRDSAIRNTSFANDPDNNTLRIIDNVIEGLSGKAMQLGSSFGVSIQGNYMEACLGGYGDLAQSTNFHNGLSITKNTVQQTPTQVSANTPAFDLKGMGNYGVHSAGNTSTGVMYKLYLDGTWGKLISTSDISYVGIKAINEPKQLVELGRIVELTNAVTYGLAAIYRFTSAITTFGAGEVKDITVSTPSIGMVHNSPDMVCVFIDLVSGSYEVVIHHYRYATDSIVVRVENKSAGSQNISVGVRVHQIK